MAAEKSVRDGLMAYDRKLGGWRGPVAHLDTVGPGLGRRGEAGAAGAGLGGPLAQVPARPACCRTGGSAWC